MKPKVYKGERFWYCSAGKYCYGFHSWRAAMRFVPAMLRRLYRDKLYG